MKVLVVDDTKNIRLLLTKCLEMEGFEVETAVEGQEALELLSKKSYDLAFIDIKLPRISGTEVLRRMREMGLTMPVVVMTAYATVKNAVDCTNLGAAAYLQKPFTADKIKTILGGLLQVREENTPEEVLSLARMKMESGHCVEAENLLKNALQKYSLVPELYSLLSQVSELLGKNADAAQYGKLYRALQN